MKVTFSRAFRLLLGALSLVAAAACSTGTDRRYADLDPHAPGIVVVAAGKPVTLTRGSTAVEITVSDVTAGVEADNDLSVPTRGQFITAKVTIAGVGGLLDIGPQDFTLLLSDGTDVQVDAVGVIGPPLRMTRLGAGQRTDGWITFNAPLGAQTGGRIAVTDPLGDDVAGIWTL